MIPFYPFIYEKESIQKDNFEPLPLYIEEIILNIPAPNNEDEELPVIIIDVF